MCPNCDILSLGVCCLSIVVFPHNVKDVTVIPRGKLVSDFQSSICPLNNLLPLPERAFASTKECKHDKIHRPVTTPWLKGVLFRHNEGRNHLPFVFLLIQGRFTPFPQSSLRDNSILNKYMRSRSHCCTTISANLQLGQKLEKNLPGTCAFNNLTQLSSGKL